MCSLLLARPCNSRVLQGQPLKALLRGAAVRCGATWTQQGQNVAGS